MTANLKVLVRVLWLLIDSIIHLRPSVLCELLQMFFDDLPLWGFIGKLQPNEKQEERYMLFTHVHFEVLYNVDRVVEISVSTDTNQAVDITEEVPKDVKFTFSAKWLPSPRTFEKRMEKYQKYSFLPQHLEIHWFSIINSCVTVLLLTGFLATILMRVLKNDFIKYATIPFCWNLPSFFCEDNLYCITSVFHVLF